MRRRQTLFAIAMLVALPQDAHAQSTDVPYDGLAFDSQKHRLWYARFWTGKCTGLSLFSCFSGEPYCHGTMRRLVAAAPPERRGALAARLFELGRKIGHEWAKENHVRRISTDHIRAWYAKMEKSDPETAIAAMEAEAARLLAGR